MQNDRRRKGLGVMEAAMVKVKQNTLVARSFIKYADDNCLSEWTGLNFMKLNHPILILGTEGNISIACPCTSKPPQKQFSYIPKQTRLSESSPEYRMDKDSTVLHRWPFPLPNNENFLKFWIKLKIKGIVPEESFIEGQWKDWTKIWRRKRS